MFSDFISSHPEQQLMVLLSITPLLMLFLNQMVNIPGLIKYRLDLFSPQYCIAGALFIGTTIRTYYLLYDPDGHQKMITLVGENLPEQIMMMGLIAINVAIFMWMIGFTYITKRPLHHYQTKRYFDSRRYIRVQLLFVSFSVIVMFLYLLKIQYFSSLGSYGISGKRMVQIGSKYGNVTTYGYLRFAGDFLATSTIVQAVYYYHYKRTQRNLQVLIGLFILATIIPFAASARGEILYLVMSILIVRHYAVRMVTPKFMLLLTVAMFILLGFLGILRVQAYSGNNAPDTSVLDATMHTLVYNAHFIGVGKTSVIVSEMPDSENFLYGKTYATTLIAPIPRVLWPDKPIVRSGRFVGTYLYHKPTFSGVPPGFIGEAYMNFGWPGLFIFMLVFGFFCKWIYRRLVLERNKDDAFRLGLYAIVWVTILDIATVDFTGNVMRFTRYIVPYMIITHFGMPYLTAKATARKPRSRTSLSKAERLRTIEIDIHV